MLNKHDSTRPVKNTNGGAVIIVVALLLFIAIAVGGGYITYNKFLKKPPLKTKLSSVKIKKELIQFSNNRISPALYHNMVMIDDILVMMDKELDRLKRINKQFPNQSEIVSPQVKALSDAHDRLSTALADATTRIEKIYVTWLVDQKEGAGQIRTQKGLLAQQLAEAIRNEAGQIGRIKNNPEARS